MAVPALSAQQRAAALAKAAQTRRARAEVKDRLKRKEVTLSQILDDARSDDTLGRMRVHELLESMPGVGKVRAAQIMDRLGIAAGRRVGGLGVNQRRSTEQQFRAAPASSSAARP
ncbi:MAG: integration host factor, actinobacterial type [Mycobacteriales bacterium]